MNTKLVLLLMVTSRIARKISSLLKPNMASGASQLKMFKLINNTFHRNNQFLLVHLSVARLSLSPKERRIPIPRITLFPTLELTKTSLPLSKILKHLRKSMESGIYPRKRRSSLANRIWLKRSLSQLVPHSDVRLEPLLNLRKTRTPKTIQSLTSVLTTISKLH